MKGRSVIRDEAVAQLLDAVPDGVLVVDLEGTIAYANRQAEEISGYSREELEGMSVDLLVPGRLRGQHVAHREHYNRQPAVRPMGSHLDIRFRKRDGAEFPADISLGFAEIGGRRLVVASVRDITGRRRQEERVQAMLDVAQAVLRQSSDEDLCDLVVERVRALTGAADAVLLTVEADGGGRLTARAAAGPRRGALMALRLEAEGELAPAGAALQIAEASEVLDDPALSGPALVVPLASASGHPGVIMLIGPQSGGSFSADEATLLEPLAAQAAVALDFARVRDDLQQVLLVEDRERIGRELHDGAIQALFAVGMNLQAMAQVSTSTAMQERLNNVVGQIDEVIRDLRNYIFGLRPELAADRHLSRALQELAERLEEEAGVACALDIDPVTASRLSVRSPDLTQLVRETLSNVARHAHATTCRITLRQEGLDAVLEVDDDGRGFVIDERTNSGWGLRNLKERAHALGGGVDVASIPGEGTTITCRIPLAGT
ncbi:MAG TPA: PAS domain S-box protein [Candidatus Dormibacteraeota bacterium]|nr:PAS domain S-box protein [Candidatus Dormibacteraeota bacterium]